MKSRMIFAFLVFVLVASAYAQTKKNILTWKPPGYGCDVCDQLFIDGQEFRVVNEENVYLAVSVEHDDDYIFGDIYILNKKDEKIDFQPETDTGLLFWKDKTTYPTNKYDEVGFVVPPEKVIKKLKRRVMWGNFLRGFAAGMATRTTKTTTPARIYLPQTGESVNATITTTETRNDAQAQRNAAIQNRAAAEKIISQAEYINSTALRANSVLKDRYVFGTVYYQKRKYGVMLANVVIAGRVYSFIYPNK